jgi:hypothetical protein
MGRLTDRIEARLLEMPEIQNIFSTGASWDQNRQKHLRVIANREKEDSHYDVFNVQFQLRSDEPIQEDIHVHPIRKALRKFEDYSVIRKVIPNGFEITNSDFALYNSAEINFIVITNIEKE